MLLLTTRSAFLLASQSFKGFVSMMQAVYNNCTADKCTLHGLRHTMFRALPNVGTLLGAVSGALSSAYNAIVVNRLKRLYRDGPAIKGFGFWRGAASADICASLTNVEAKFWAVHADECERLIDADCMSYIILFETLLYFYLLWWLVRSSTALLCSALRNALRKRGLVERYSPNVLDWLHHKFPSTLVHYDDAKERRRVMNDIRAGDNDDSPYSAYSSRKEREQAAAEKVAQ